MDPPKTPAPSVDQLLEWLEHALTDCADLLERKPDAFLWSARRCAEAVCLVALVQQQKRHDKLDEQSLQKLSEQVEAKHRSSVVNIQLAGNYAVHVQPTERFDLSHLRGKAFEVRESLCPLVEWLYKEVLKRPLPSRVVRDLDCIRAVLGATASTPGRPTMTPQATHNPWGGVAGLALGLVIGALAFALWSGVRSSAQSAPLTPTTMLPPTTTPTAPTPNVADPAPVALAHDAGVPEAPSRPVPRPGAVFVPAGEVVIGQPNRDSSHWPRAVHPNDLPRAEVPGFQVDGSAVSTRDYAACVEGHACDPVVMDRACNGAASPDASQTCVTWTQADAYCRSLSRHLPTLAQWERLGDLSLASVRRPLEFEWVSDVFPSPVLDRGAQGPCRDDVGQLHADCHHVRGHLLNAHWTPRFSWSAHATDRRLANKGFRCVD